jgi:PAS domain S-box-containing protein
MAGAAISPESFLAAVVASADEAIVGKALDGTILSWNPAAERLYGYPADEAVGANITMLAPADRPDEMRTILGRIARGERIYHFQTVRRRRDGGLVDISVTISPIRQEGAIIGASAIARDVSDERRRAVRLNDQVVQGLLTAKLALETGDTERAMAAVTHTLEAARAIVAGLLATAPISPGSLRSDQGV